MAAGEPDNPTTPPQAAPPEAAPPAAARPGAEAEASALHDPLAIGRSMADVAELSRRLVGDWLRRQVLDPAEHSRSGESDPLGIGGAFMEMTARLMVRPSRLVQAQLGFWQDYLTLWQNSGRRMWGLPVAPVIQPGSADPRFTGQAWKDGEVFDFIKQSYLLSARYVQDVTGHVDGLSPRAAQKVDFYARQFVEAMSPSNFLLTNPEVLRRTAESGGENLLRGLNNLLMDLERGRGRLTSRLSERDAFRLGETVGVTPGRVVFQNELVQLIQYAPATTSVLARPLMVVPPWTNKFYALDLRPRNSFVRWAVAQGHTVFMLSWVNPVDTGEHRMGGSGAGGSEVGGFEAYMRQGVLDSLDAVVRLTGAAEVNAVGHGLGGTLLAATLAWMSRNDDHRIASLTLLTTMLDFSEAGELGVFIDESQLATLDRRQAAAAPAPAPGRDAGTAGASALADGTATFSMLRANDLIWSFVVNNYLMGNDPFPFDLLHWNSDAVRLPGSMHGFYLHRIYQANELARPNALTLLGTPIDLGCIDLPTYVLAARDDHIAPWRSVYRGTLGGNARRRFVLSAAGHLAGVVNPPDGGRYSHWINADSPEAPQEWLGGAAEMSGSWWTDWQRWVLAQDRVTGPARLLDGGGELAPGSFVQVRAA